MNKTTVFKVREGTIRNIATGPTKFLGQILSDTLLAPQQRQQENTSLMNLLGN